MLGQFDDAMNLVNETGMDALVSDPFARFHPSKIALHRLQLILSAGTVSTEQAMIHSQESLQSLVAGALSENEHGQRAFLSAADSLLHWPKEEALRNPPHCTMR
jgi:hypothetical protein